MRGKSKSKVRKIGPRWRVTILNIDTTSDKELGETIRIVPNQPNIDAVRVRKIGKIRKQVEKTVLN